MIAGNVFRLRTKTFVILIPAVVAVGLGVLTCIERKLEQPGDYGVLTFKGLGITEDRSVLGIIPLRIEGQNFDGGYWVADISKPDRSQPPLGDDCGYVPLKGYYPDGAVRQISIVKLLRDWSGYRIDIDDVWEGTFFSTDGTSISTVEEGNGKQSICDKNDQLVWEQTLSGGKVQRLRRWYPDGKPMLDYRYIDGVKNGVSLSYYRNGTLKSQVTYARGQVVKALRWNRDGSEAAQTM